jgi:hypothetical protein
LPGIICNTSNASEFTHICINSFNIVKESKYIKHEESIIEKGSYNTKKIILIEIENE